MWWERWVLGVGWKGCGWCGEVGLWVEGVWVGGLRGVCVCVCMCVYVCVCAHTHRGRVKGDTRVDLSLLYSKCFYRHISSGCVCMYTVHIYTQVYVFVNVLP